MAIRGVHPGRAKALATEEHLTNFPEEQIIAAVRHRSASSVAATIRSASSVAFLARLAKLEVPTEEGMAMAVPTEEEEEMDEDEDEQNNDQRRRKEKRETTTTATTAD